MQSPPPNRWLKRILIGLLVLVVIGALGLHLATRELRHQVAQALGPNAEVAAIEAGIRSITIRGIRVRANQGWPTEDELRATRIVVTPDWGALMSQKIGITRIEIDGAYLAMLRQKDGRLALLPSLLGLPQAPGKATAGSPAKNGSDKEGSGKATTPDITIGEIVLRDAAVDFLDASIRTPPHRLRLDGTAARVGPLQLPALSGRTDIDLTGVFQGPRQDGKLTIRGWVELATRDSDVRIELAGADLVAFQPYLVKAADASVRKGTLDLSLHAKVRSKRLDAPGRLTLVGLELASGKSFMGMPRDAVVAMMKDHNGRITAEFALRGNIDDPRFSLNETFLAEIGTATAKVLGISLEGLARGIGGVGTSAASGVGSAVNKLFGKSGKEDRR